MSEINEGRDTEPVSCNALVRSNSLHVPRRTTSCCSGGGHGDLIEKKNRYMQRHTPRKDKQECTKAIIQMFHSTVPLEILLTARGGGKGPRLSGRELQQ